MILNLKKNISTSIFPSCLCRKTNTDYMETVSFLTKKGLRKKWVKTQRFHGNRAVVLALECMKRGLF